MPNSLGEIDKKYNAYSRFIVKNGSSSSPPVAMPLAKGLCSSLQQEMESIFLRISTGLVICFDLWNVEEVTACQFLG